MFQHVSMCDPRVDRTKRVASSSHGTWSRDLTEVTAGGAWRRFSTTGGFFGSTPFLELFFLFNVIK
jgi:hypothetical protein